MRWRAAAWLVALAFIVPQVASQTWDPSKPPTSGLLVSADLRSNWNALAQTMGGINLLADPTFLIWPAGDTSAPAHWSFSGTGATITRQTGTVKVGSMAPTMTSGASAAAILQQQLLDSGAFQTFLQSQTVSCGAWLRGTSASAVRIGIYDGVGTGYSSYGPSGSWAWETVTRTIDASATELTFRVEVASGTVSGYVSGATCLLGPVAPQFYQPAPARYEQLQFFFTGNVSAATDQRRLHPVRPFLVKDVFLTAGTAPGTQSLIVDINTWDSAFVSMFTSGNRPSIPAGTQRAIAQPDSTSYKARCSTGSFSTGTPAAGELLSIDIDQVGVSPTGADLTVWLRVLTYERPLEEFLAYDDVK